MEKMRKKKFSRPDPFSFSLSSMLVFMTITLRAGETIAGRKIEKGELVVILGIRLLCSRR